MVERPPVCLIVGAGDAIGAAVGRRFAAGGFHVCLARRDREALAPLLAGIEDAGGSASGWPLDARDEDQVASTFLRIEAERGPLDCVLFNVGGNVQRSARDTSARLFRKVWEQCCLGGFLVGREAAEHMLPRGRGSLFFTGATASVRGGAGYAAFASAKAGLRNLAQSLARELGPEGIHVAHLVIDAGVDTPWVRDRIRESGRDPEGLPADTLMRPDSVAEAYWQLHAQARDGWTFELDLRPFAERW